MPLIEVRVSPIHPRIELARERCFREYPGAHPHAFEYITLIVYGVTVRIRDLELQPFLELPPQSGLECKIVRISGIRDERIVCNVPIYRPRNFGPRPVDRVTA